MLDEESCRSARKCAAPRLLCGAKIMTVDADITAEILRDIRDRIDRNHDEVKAAIHELRTEVRTELGVVTLRLDGVERTLVQYVQEHRMLAQFVKGVARRVEKLEAE